MNVLQTVEVSATQPGSKEATINQGQAQLALAVNGVATFSADTNPTLLVTDLLRNSKLILTCTGAGHTVTFTPVQRTTIWLRTPSANTNPISVICGATSIPLSPGLFFIAEFDGTADGMTVNQLSTLGTSPFVLKAGDTMTGTLQLPAGTIGTPSLNLGETAVGFYSQAAGFINAVTNSGNSVWSMSANTFSFSVTGGAANLNVAADSLAQQIADTYTNAVTGSRFVLRKGRGTRAVPLVIVQNDQVFTLQGQGHNGTNFTVAYTKQAIVTEATPSASVMGSRVTESLNPIGSVTQTEITRLEHATGFSMFGANPVIDANRHFRLRSYTIATVPAATPAGQVFYVSDQFSGQMAYTDGTNVRYNVPCFIGSTEIIRPSTTGIAIGSGFAAVEALHVRRTGATVSRALVEGESGSVSITAARYATSNGSPPSFLCDRGRGTIASPAVIIQNDDIFSLAGRAYDGAAFRVPFEMVGTVIAATPSSSDMQLRATVLIAPASSVTRTEIIRLEHATGLSLFGANPVFDPSRHLVLRQYTNAGKPAASSNTGKKIFITDYLGGVEVCSDGTDWIVGTDVFVYALSDETTAITTGTAKLTTRAPYKSKIVDLKANLNTVSSSGIPTVDINGNAGTTYLSTKLTIDVSEKTSRTAAAAYVLSTSTFAEDDEITFDIDVAGTGAKGLKVHMTLKHVL